MSITRGEVRARKADCVGAWPEYVRLGPRRQACVSSLARTGQHAAVASPGCAETAVSTRSEWHFKVGRSKLSGVGCSMVSVLR
jgi:hypothetical protein